MQLLKHSILIVILLLPVYQNSSGAEVGSPWRLSEQYGNGDVFMRVRLLGSVRIDKTKVDGYAARELSGLAWDDDEKLLYAVSDDGYLVHFAPQFTDGFLSGVDFKAAYPLRETNNEPVEGEWSDSEALAIINGRNGLRGDAELLVSFEVHPRLLRYRPTGERIAQIDLPEQLRAIENYAGENSGLESLALHREHGILLAPERPLKNTPSETIPVYSMQGKQWVYKPRDSQHSSLVGMETTPDGYVLLLERLYASIFRPIYFSVRRMKLFSDGAAAPIEEIVSFSRSDWRVDNFEGVAYHEHDRFFLVSDDNESSLQRTLLVYCEIVDAKLASDSGAPLSEPEPD